VDMSKANMVVLSLLSAAPMHGYQIGNLVDHIGLPHWTGITLPAIYKAIQALDKAKYISGTEMREGNNPPRMVFELMPKGKELLREILRRRLAECNDLDKDWWLALMFAQQAMTKTEMLHVIACRIQKLQNLYPGSQSCEELSWPGHSQAMPFVHKHLVSLGERSRNAEMQTLQELEEDIKSDTHNEFFALEGDSK